MDEIIASTYQIIEKLGAGGGGNVYLAYHMRLGKKVVLKADKRKLTTSPELLRKEVDILKELKHARIPRVYDFFVEDGIVYTAMEYVEGESLDRPLKRGEKYPQSQVILWAIQLLDALEYLHSPIHGTPPKGYVHSDIKPANLMRTADNNISLIDFNIALALGETRVIGASAGYASPEHYGRDFSFSSSTSQDTETMAADRVDMEDEVTENMDKPGEDRATESMSNLRVKSSARKLIVPDVRSDIYSVGATLYHLLSGRRPAKEATDVEPLPASVYSPLLVQIITKAMDPNPDLRYQTAAEMKEAFLNIRENDPRTRKWKRKKRIAGVVFPLVIAAGSATAFVGLKRMQVTESWLKLAEYASNALELGDVEKARADIRQAIPEKDNPLTPTIRPEVQRVLASVLDVYDVSDGYKQEGVIELPSELLGIRIAPDGQTGVCSYSGGIAVVDLQKEEIILTLTTNGSALAEVEYLDGGTLLYAGKNGLECCDIGTGDVLWTGQPATRISISGDGSRVATVYKDDAQAYLYDAMTGEELLTVDFEGRHQSVVVHDSFADPEDDLFALSRDGTYLAASFDDGSLSIINTEDTEKSVSLFKEGSGYEHFEGGFSGQYLAFSATSEEESVFAVVDTDTMEQTGGFRSEESKYSVKADDSGINILSGNILTRIDPVTGDQTPLVTSGEKILRYDTTGADTLIVTEDALQFFDEHACLLTEYKNTGSNSYAALSDSMALAGTLDSPMVRLLKYETSPDNSVLAYEPGYIHDEARISADGETVMQFSFEGFRIYSVSGELIAETELPDAEQIYDQQFIREEKDSWLEVTYNDGTVKKYSASDGSLLGEEKIDEPDPSLYEELETNQFRVESNLHGGVRVYAKENGKLVCELAEDAYLAYLTQAGELIVAQYVDADGYCYGQLLNEKWEVLADLPYLCDVAGETLYFDYPASGYMRKTHIYHIDELKGLLDETSADEPQTE